MDRKTYLQLKSWFDDYSDGFSFADLDKQQNIDLKKEHTYKVCEAIRMLGQALGLGDKDLYLVSALALFHDVGRFEQYARYQTFCDQKSEDHAMLGAKTLFKHAVLDSLPPNEAQLILRSVAYHNRFSLPASETPRCLFFTRLLRDADKLDIYRVVTEYYNNSSGKKNETIELDLPDTPYFCDEIFQDVLSGQRPKMSDMRQLNDFKLLQLGWVYDINFPETLSMVDKKGYLHAIYRSLSSGDQADRAFEAVMSYVKKKRTRQNHKDTGLVDGFEQKDILHMA